MKRYLTALVFCGVFSVISFHNIQAGDVVRSAGIGVRGSYWKISDTGQKFTVKTNPNYTEANVGGGGGGIYFLSRMDRHWLAEVSLGAVGQVETRVAHRDGEDVHVSAVTPLLLGFRNDLFASRNQRPIQPYLSFGAGPYWFSEITSHEDFWETETEATIHSKIKAGGYLGGGLNFMLSTWFGLNFDLKYHFIDFNVKHERSGIEYALGLVFLWGKFEG